MRGKVGAVGRVFVAAALATSLGGCFGSAEEPTTEEVEQEPIEETTTEEVAPDAGGRIDITQTGSQLATFEGAKYIVSDATVDQTQGEAFGLQEICVVRQDGVLAGAGSIGWNRNSIAYNDIARDWGTMSYRFEYINEAGSESAEASWSRTTEAGYFGEGVEVSHAEVAGHQVAYVLDDTQGEIAFGIVDMEAEGMGQSSFVNLHAWELRGDQCALAVTVSCEVRPDAAADLGAEAILADAYASLDFVASDAEVDAASYAADVAITSADGARQVTIRREGADLLGYTPHAATLMASDDAQGYSTLVIDFAPEGGLEAMELLTASTDEYDGVYGYTDVQVSDVEQHEVDGLVANVRVVSATMDMGEQGSELSRELRAWMDVDGDALYVRTTMLADEDVEDAVARVLVGRVNLA